MALERCVADLEGGARGFAFASGLAGMATVLDVLDAGAHVVASDDLYGGTYRLFERVRKRSAGLARQLRRPDRSRRACEAAIRPDTRMLWVETPTNPLLKLVDLAAVAKIARAARSHQRCRQHLRQPLDPAAARARLRHRRALDDQVSERPFRHGRRRRRRRRRARSTRSSPSGSAYLQNAVGGVAGPFDSFLALRGLKTLALRMERHCAMRGSSRSGSGRTRRSQRVFYPGTRRATRSTRWRSGRCTPSAAWSRSCCKADLAGTKRFLERCRLFALAESLGGVESLIEHPAIMTHGSIPARAARRSRASATRWCGSRWVSRTSTTCAATCARRSTPSDRARYWLRARSLRFPRVDSPDHT